jgi:hypothetical protein
MFIRKSSNIEQFPMFEGAISKEKSHQVLMCDPLKEI